MRSLLSALDVASASSAEVLPMLVKRFVPAVPGEENIVGGMHQLCLIFFVLVDAGSVLKEVPCVACCIVCCPVLG